MQTAQALPDVTTTLVNPTLANQFAVTTSEIVEPNTITVFTRNQETPVIKIDPDGRIFWNGREVESDDEFKGAMMDMRNCLMGIVPR